MSAAGTYGAVPPAGPRWQPPGPDTAVGGTQTDGRGTRWIITRITDGGRTLHWETCTGALRTAVTTAAPDHPDYPSDDAVVAYDRRQKALAKAATAAARDAARWYP